jgi:hypothetical protein
LPGDIPSPGSVSVGSCKVMGADPSPMMMNAPVVVFAGTPLTAEIAPASIKLASAPIKVFFTVKNLLMQSLLSSSNATLAELSGQGLLDEANEAMEAREDGQRQVYY